GAGGLPLGHPASAESARLRRPRRSQKPRHRKRSWGKVSAERAMRSLRILAMTTVIAWSAAPRAFDGADPPRRKPLDANQRAALTTLLHAVDVAQGADDDSDAPLDWHNHILKANDQTAYVPFRLTLAAPGDSFKSTAMYVRAVSRPA